MVQGGARFFEPTVVTERVKRDIEELEVLAPLHNPANLAGIVAAGGRAEVRRWDGVLHGFPGMTAELPEAAASLQWSADRLRDLLSED